MAPILLFLTIAAESFLLLVDSANPEPLLRVTAAILDYYKTIADGFRIEVLRSPNIKRHVKIFFFAQRMLVCLVLLMTWLVLVAVLSLPHSLISTSVSFGYHKCASATVEYLDATLQHCKAPHLGGMLAIWVQAAQAKARQKQISFGDPTQATKTLSRSGSATDADALKLAEIATQASHVVCVWRWGTGGNIGYRGARGNTSQYPKFSLFPSKPSAITPHDNNTRPRRYQTTGRCSQAAQPFFFPFSGRQAFAKQADKLLSPA
jgi:hypothetical protein